MTIPILFEDHVLVVINKPPGIIVNRAESVKVETIQDWVESTYQVSSIKYQANNQENTPVMSSRPSGSDQFIPLTEKHEVSPSMSSRTPIRDPSGKSLESHGTDSPVVADEYDITHEFYSRSGIVHRIDKETSGILLIAKTPESFGALKAQFMERTIQKTYLAIVHGPMPSQEGEINAPVGRQPWNKEQWGVVPDGKESVTLYKVLKTFERKGKKGNEIFQLVECYPKTGRTHQIRVHLKYLNRPILGDYLYAGRKTARDDRTWAPRVMLHAARVTFIHPATKVEMNLEAPLPEDMSSIII